MSLGTASTAGGGSAALDADHLRFRLKTPWSDGTTHLVLSPLELIEELAALVPPPRHNLVRYHGILAPNAGFRRLVVPGRSVSPSTSSVGGYPFPLSPSPGPGGFIGAGLGRRHHHLYLSGPNWKHAPIKERHFGGNKLMDLAGVIRSYFLCA